MGAGLYEAAFSTLAGLRPGGAPLDHRDHVDRRLRARCAGRFPLPRRHDRLACDLLRLGGGASHARPADQPAAAEAAARGIRSPGPGGAAAGPNFSCWLDFLLCSPPHGSAARPWRRISAAVQESGASLAAAARAAALVGPAQVGARVLEFWFMRRFHPIVSARTRSLAHPIGAAGLMAAGSPAASRLRGPPRRRKRRDGESMGTLPLALFGRGWLRLAPGAHDRPARFISASAPFLFDLLLSRYGTASLLVTGLSAFPLLRSLR